MSDRFTNGLTIFTWSSPKASLPLLNGFQALPTGEGDVMIVGRVTKGGRPLARQEIRILFSGAVSSPVLVTSDSGEFRLRMPQGKWQLQGPIIPAMPNAVFRFETTGAIENTNRSIDVRLNGPIRIVEMQIDVQSP